MADRITYVGLDVHKEESVVAVATGGLRGEVREYGRIANTPTALERLLRKLGGDGESLRFWCEAGPCGYGIQRQVSATGHECVVVPPLADPQASRRPGQDRPAGCCQPGQAAPGRRADGGVGSGCSARGDAAELDAGPRRGGAADNARHGAGQCGDADRRTGRSLALRQSAPAHGLSRAGAVRTFQRCQRQTWRHHQGRQRSGPPVVDRGGVELPFPGPDQPQAAAAAGEATQADP
jgi:hypothetical protein